MDDTAADKILNLLLGSSTWLVWPYFGSGNALQRIILAHDEYDYNPDWNSWGVNLESPITPPRQLTVVATDCLPTKKLYSVAHNADYFGGVPSRNSDSLILHARETLESLLIDKKWCTWLAHWYKKQTRLVFGVGHLSAGSILKHTDQPIIQLYYRDITTLSKRWPLNTQISERITQFDESNIEFHPQICNLSIEDFFWSDYTTFKQSYYKLIEHLNIEDDRLEQTWAFILYYRDRIDRTIELDRATS